MLDGDTSVDASRKHLIFVSDGITYMFNETPTAVNWHFWSDGSDKSFAGPDNWKTKYGSDDSPAAGWKNWLNDIESKLATQDATYDYPYGQDAEKRGQGTDVNKPNDYANSIDKALYLTAKVYQECKAKGYNCYSLVADQNKGTQYQWGPSFIKYLADGKELNFEAIEAEILYMLGKGSTVVDVIGDKFDLIPGSFQLTVGGNTYPVTHNGNNYTFGSDKQYQVEYNPAGESFTFTIGENVTNFQRVQLSYKLKVANPETAPGTYGQYDRDGSKGYDGLYTNESAVLTPVDSNRNQGEKETFQKPTVSYTVNGTTPAEPTTTPDVPKTGDASTPALWLALCALSAAAFLALSRRRAA